MNQTSPPDPPNPPALERRSASPLFTAREQRLLLWLTVGAICWRWLLAVQTPLPSVDACRDLWLAGRLLQGDVAPLWSAWAQPGWALLMAPACAVHESSFQVAQVLACTLGGLAVWPAAVAAERLRQGAGLPAAILVLAASGASLLAGAGSAAALLSLVAACAAACFVSSRWWLAALATLMVVGSGLDSWLHRAVGSVGSSAGTAGHGWSEVLANLRLGWGVAGALMLLSALPPRPRRLPALWLVTAAVLAAAGSLGLGPRWLIVWSPLVGVLAGVGLARLPGRWRDLLLCAAVGLQFYSAWHAVEPRAAVAERALGRYLRSRLAPGERLVSDLPRVLLFAGQAPTGSLDAEALLQRASDRQVAWLVLGPNLARQATLTAALAGRFERLQLPHDLGDLIAERHLTAFVRR